MCGTHFTLSCRILLFSLPITTNNFFEFVYSEILGESAWQVLFRPPWCYLLLWQLKVIRTGLTWILDFWYPGPSYFVQEVLVHYFFVCNECPVQKKWIWRVQSLADTVASFLTILQFSSELSNNWGMVCPVCALHEFLVLDNSTMLLYFHVCFPVFPPCVYTCWVMDCTYHFHKSFPSTLVPLHHLCSAMLTALFQVLAFPF